MRIIDNIEKIMKDKKITAYQMEKDIGISQKTFANWKKGSQPAVDKIQLIIPYLGVTPNEVFGYMTESELNENEKELLEHFKKLPEREQIKFIARVEDATIKYQAEHRELESSDSKIG